MRIEKLNLNHQKILSPLLQNMQMDLSEYSFANAYLFRQKHEYEMVFYDEIFLKGMTYDGFTYLMPTSPMDRTKEQKLTQLLKTVDFLFPIPERWLPTFDPMRYRIEAQDRDNDYLFSLDKIRYYPGRKLSGKRNLVKQFKENYPVEAFSLTQERTVDALSILTDWQQNAHHPEQITDYFPCQEALGLLEILELKGLIFYYSGFPIGFVIGEPLNSQVFVIHFAKAKRGYKGIYQFLYQSIANDVNDQYAFLNFEQDLGLPELRQAKESYEPDKLYKKFRVGLLR